MKQQSFATVKDFEKAHRTTHKAAFLSRMERLRRGKSFAR
jgi:hypothetical protein